jgi:UV DNA damage endonuclease
MMRFGVCCIVLSLGDQDPPMKFQKMTYSNFSKIEHKRAIEILGSRILNNIKTTLYAIKFCHSKNYCYRLSSDLFPLITYKKANVNLENLPTYDEIKNVFFEIKNFLKNNPTRISTHPSEFNVLASTNRDAVDKTIKELNFYSWFMDQIGCPPDYNSPINLHINNNQGSPQEIISRLKEGISKLDINCQNRLVIENDDKTACWSVRKLIDFYFDKLNKPITFDFLHHKCHPDGLDEEQAIKMCYKTWHNFRPLFHFSESKDEKKIRAHSDYPSFLPNNYELDFDLDFEFKMKEKAIEFLEKKISIKL